MHKQLEFLKIYDVKSCIIRGEHYILDFGRGSQSKHLQA